VYGCEGKFEDIREGKMYHKITTSIGQSGSPILVEYEGKLCVVGVHIGYNGSLMMNVGVQLTSMIISILRKWYD